MDLPSWAERALAQFEPKPTHLSDHPDAGQLAQWRALSGRFRERWDEIGADDWSVPEEHPRYGQLLRSYLFPPSEYVRQCILECAIESAWEMGANKDPGATIEAVRELDRLNDLISEGAQALAILFKQRAQIKDDFYIGDRQADEQEAAPDAFRLAGALELTLKKHQFRTASFEHRSGLETFYRAMNSSNGREPTIADLLDEISWRMPRVVTSFDPGDIAVMGSKTNRSEWSPWALRLIARLDDWPGNGLLDGFFLDCLTNEQLATLAMVSVDAPPGAYSAPQIRELKKRYRARKNV